MSRVFAICLDGYEVSVEEEMIAAGKMPALRALREESARFFLDHGSALRTGLAGEHVATGLSPEAAGRWAAVHFDPGTYAAWQEGTSLKPFPELLRSRTVVFDLPYFDLSRAPSVSGLVSWGAHDPGVASGSNPPGVLSDAIARFGDYPARRWIYGTPWNSPIQAKEMGDRLADAVGVRAQCAGWLFRERLPDWDLALLTVSEAHSAIEGLWHGVDRSHPLHGCPSASAAREGVEAVYAGIDVLVGDMRAAFPDAAFVVFSMHGMGPNRADAASMLLLPELMYRSAFRRPLFARQGIPSADLHGRVAMEESETWHTWVNAGFPSDVDESSGSPLTQMARQVLPNSLKRAIKSLVRRDWSGGPKRLRLSVDWMPATRYQPHWHRMPAFALPSYYDGRVRLNLRGRESKGIVDPSLYESARDEVIAVIRACKDCVTGESIVEGVEYGARGDPRDLGPTEADLIITWRDAPQGLVHPEFGQIGPVPYRRTGGHTGRHGFAYVCSSQFVPGDWGYRNAHDIVPTLIHLLGEDRPAAVSGLSLVGGGERAA